jgi:hypothetical protein
MGEIGRHRIRLDVVGASVTVVLGVVANPFPDIAG